MDIQITPRPQWASASSYFLVTLGAIVGLGNILFFPLLVVQYGGLFIGFYLLCELLLAVPLLYAELILGHRGKQNVVGSITLLSYTAKASSHWRKLGWLYFTVAFFTFSYYVVNAALPIEFLIDSIHVLLTPEAKHLPLASNNHLLTNFFALAACVLFLLLSAMWVVGRGIHRGLERISCLTVPLYFTILLVLAIYMMFANGSMTAFKNLLFSHPSHSIMSVFFAALSFAFLKLNVGIGSMVAYGSYLPFSVSLKRSTCWILLFDMVISLLACLTIMPLISPLSPDTSIPGALNNQHISIAFAHIPHGAIIALLFFCTAVLAAWTPLIAILETMVATISEEWNMLRLRAVWLVGAGLFSLACVFAVGQTSWFSQPFLEQLSSAHFLREITLEKFTPLAAFFMALFVGWVIDQRINSTELQFKPWLFHSWRFLLRYVIPVLIIIIFIYGFFNDG